MSLGKTWLPPLFLLIALGLFCPYNTEAEQVVELPVLAASHANTHGAFEILLIWWDQKTEPDPVALQWFNAGVRLGDTHVGAMTTAFRYAVERTPAARHQGTVSVRGIAYVPTSTDGPSAGAAMAVGFIALFNGDHIRRGIALTGTLESNGHIGPVGAIADKVRAAAREGCHTVLIPQGQTDPSPSEISHLALELNLTIKEVRTIDDAYVLMTGKSL